MAYEPGAATSEQAGAMANLFENGYIGANGVKVKIRFVTVP